ncbi:hypothetical protein [Emticicia sp. BO119]|uniref:DUF7668 domain-containing protein n=1 Tax=Emticicia sp. BO119 TaxID=2757768 RepID=UPI0015F05AF0|nr:hypothetical protein [Emticicia sp. BO119]MBA4852199.1 hypothetical protein [Emticicia sp. BO119]
MKKEKINKTLQSVVKNLAIGNFNLVFESDKNQRLNIVEIETVIKEYGGTITFPPAHAFNNYVGYSRENEKENFIEFNLWFDDVESDLTLSITIYETEEYSIEDIRVL